MKPVQNYVEKYVGFAEKLDDDAFLENYFAMERWANDNIPVAGETFREFVKHLYQQNQLVMGEFQLQGQACQVAEHYVPSINACCRAGSPGAAKFDIGDPTLRFVEVYSRYVDQRRTHWAGCQLESTQAALAGRGDVDCGPFDELRALKGATLAWQYERTYPETKGFRMDARCLCSRILIAVGLVLFADRMFRPA